MKVIQILTRVVKINNKAEFRGHINMLFIRSGIVKLTLRDIIVLQTVLAAHGAH